MTLELCLSNALKLPLSCHHLGSAHFCTGEGTSLFFLFTYMLPVSDHDFNGIDAQTSISLCVLFPYYSVPEIGLEKERK